MKKISFNKKLAALLLAGGIALGTLTGCSGPIPTISAFTEESDDITLSNKNSSGTVLICELEYSVFGRPERNIFFAKAFSRDGTKLFFDLFSGKLLATENDIYQNYLVLNTITSTETLRRYVDINSDLNENTFSFEELYTLLIKVRQEYNEIGFEKMFYFKQK